MADYDKYEAMPDYELRRIRDSNKIFGGFNEDYWERVVSDIRKRCEAWEGYIEELLNLREAEFDLEREDHDEGIDYLKEQIERNRERANEYKKDLEETEWVVQYER